MTATPHPTPALDLVCYTDPYCTWCWGSEPVLRRIAETYGDQVSMRFVMGGLVEDISQFHDTLNDIGGPDWQRQVAAHWLEASARHGMPVNVEEFTDLDAHFSTYPACIAVKAAQLQDARLAERYLRRLREGAAVEALPIHLPDVQARLAAQVGLDPDRLLADIKGPARDAFEADLNECIVRGVRGFPTFLLGNRSGETRMLRGYQPFDTFAVAFEHLSMGGLLRRDPVASDDAIVGFVAKYGRAAPREVAEVFGLQDEDVLLALSNLVAAGRLAAQAAGNGTLYRLA